MTLYCLGRFTDLTGSDYSDGAIELAQAVAEREGLANITFVVSFKTCACWFNMETRIVHQYAADRPTSLMSNVSVDFEE